MRINVIDGEPHIQLEKGEPIPVYCNCGEYYQPELNSECSTCPCCGRLNHHEHCPSWTFEFQEDTREIRSPGAPVPEEPGPNTRRLLRNDPKLS